MYQPGDRVLFTPKNPRLEWAAGNKVVKYDHGGGVIQLECGNIVLLARADELTKL